MIDLNKIIYCFTMQVVETVFPGKEGGMESKIRIKLGAIEIEYEGSESFLRKELPDLIKTVTELAKTSKITEDTGEDDDTSGQKDLRLSTGSIAAKLSCSTGSDLVIAAATHLSLVKKVAVFSRKQLLDEMKSASGFYKSTYPTNLSSYLKTLLRANRLTETKKGNYSLTASESQKIRGQLAN
jgi:hypothetical protein